MLKSRRSSTTHNFFSRRDQANLISYYQSCNPDDFNDIYDMKKSDIYFCSKIVFFTLIVNNYCLVIYDESGLRGLKYQQHFT